jgi:hypothetical protein
VWKALVAQGKAFDVSALTSKALLHNLDEKYYGRPLAQLRDLFWNTPRPRSSPPESPICSGSSSRQSVAATSGSSALTTSIERSPAPATSQSARPG